MTWDADDYRPLTRLILGGIILLLPVHLLPWRYVESPDGRVPQAAFEASPTLARVTAGVLPLAGAAFAVGRAPGLRPSGKEFLRFLGQSGVPFVVLVAVVLGSKWGDGSPTVRVGYGLWLTLAAGFGVVMLGGGLLRAAHGRPRQ